MSVNNSVPRIRAGTIHLVNCDNHFSGLKKVLLKCEDSALFHGRTKDLKFWGSKNCLTFYRLNDELLFYV